MGRTKSLSNEARDHLRKIVQAWIDKEFPVAGQSHGNVQAAAKRLGHSQSALYALLHQNAGGGPALLERLANTLGLSFDELLGRSPPKKRARPPVLRVQRYEVTFTLEVEGARDADELVEEAVTALVDEELSAHSDGGSRCGLRFHDATMFHVGFVEEVQP